MSPPWPVYIHISCSPSPQPLVTTATISFHSKLSQGTLKAMENTPVAIMNGVLGNNTNSSNSMLKICYDFSFNPDGTFEDIKSYSKHARYANRKLRTAAQRLNEEFFINNAATYCSFQARDAFDVLVGYEIRARTHWRGALSFCCGTREKTDALGIAADTAGVTWVHGDINHERGEVGVEFPASFLTCYRVVYQTLLAVESLYELTKFEQVEVEDPEERHFLCSYLTTGDWSDFTVRIIGEQNGCRKATHTSDCQETLCYCGEL